MIIAVAIVWVVEAPIDQVADVAAVRHRFMAASGSVHMTWLMPQIICAQGRTLFRILVGDLDNVLFNIIAILVMQVAIVQIVHVITMPYGRMPTLGSMHMIVVCILGFGAHCVLSVFVVVERISRSSKKA
ncbi:hypothetical protein PUV47_02695 [Pseudovibrio exalbescens]|uniref:hypothetical protein n=1 Tax=Pseudovibrio exalbescens TaxID=197461 RepID=UPI0023666606|nr:hypothetical protein [Pseudovibrio exalbescens]MDD7908814.1 hypothetical protein [Pseudovibrio exalbescens]